MSAFESFKAAWAGKTTRQKISALKEQEKHLDKLIHDQFKEVEDGFLRIKSHDKRK